MSKHMHLFLAVPNNSGGTLLAQLLGSSHQATTFASRNCEGQWVAQAAGDGLMPFPAERERRNWTVSLDKFGDPGNYDWERLATAWHDAWDATKPVRIEKTPSLVISAPLFEKRFSHAHFILSIRNPYAFCEGVRRRETHSVGDAARHWVATARLQSRNLAILDRTLLITYEELCDRPREAARRIAEFVPALHDIDVDRSFVVMDAEGPIRNRNPDQIGRLSGRDLEQINAALTSRPDLLDEFGYELIRPRPG